MPDAPEGGTEVIETPEQGGALAGDTPPEGEPAGNEPEGGNPSPEDDLPEWAQKELTKARGDAANYRTRLRETEARFKDAKTPEEFAEALAESTDKIASLEREILVRDVADAAGLPKELAARLKGSTKEELEADAKELAKFAPVEGAPGSLSGGLDPSDSADEDADLTPSQLAEKYGPRRR